MAPKWVPYGEDYATSNQKRKLEMEEHEELLPLQTPLLHNPRIRKLLGGGESQGTSSPLDGASFPVSSMNHSTSVEVDSDQEMFDEMDEDEVMAKKKQLEKKKRVKGRYARSA